MQLRRFPIYILKNLQSCCNSEHIACSMLGHIACSMLGHIACNMPGRITVWHVGETIKNMNREVKLQMGRILNVEYSAIQGSYWMIYGVICSFASVFLLNKGYSNSEIGIILAAANVLSVVIQPLVADFADRSKKLSLVSLLEIMTVIMMIMTVGLFASKRKPWLSLLFLFCLRHGIPLFSHLLALFALSFRKRGTMSASALVEVWGLFSMLS